MSDVIDLEGRRTAELLKRKAETMEEVEMQERAAYEIGVELTLDMFDRLSEREVDRTHAGMAGAITGVLYAVIRCAFDVSPSVDVAREFIAHATDAAEEQYHKGEI